MSYIKSLRFRLMLLCVIPLVAVATVFISNSVLIAYRVKDAAATAYTAAVSGAGDDVIRAVQGVSFDMGWIAVEWAVLFAITFVFCYIPITLTIKKIITPIRQMAKYSDSLAEGNVQVDVEKTRTDEIGILQESFHKLVVASNLQAELIQRMAEGDISGSYTPRSANDTVGHSLVKMLENNNYAMRQVSVSTEQLAVAAEQITNGSQSLASGSSQQAASIDALSAAIHEISDIIKDDAEMAGRAANLAGVIKVNAEKGNRQMDEMVAAVKEINNASHDISKVIKAIDDIAFQTNILALNASVEAARAGQHGKGFAVVADEVRSLAAKSADAAKETGTLIANSIEKAALGARIADDTAASLTEIVTGINESSQLFVEISKSAESQSVGIRQINSSIEQVSQVVQQNSATAQESAASCIEMSTQFDILKELVSQFKLKGDNRSAGARMASPPKTGISVSQSGGKY